MKSFSVVWALVGRFKRTGPGGGIGVDRWVLGEFTRRRGEFLCVKFFGGEEGEHELHPTRVRPT